MRASQVFGIDIICIFGIKGSWKWFYRSHMICYFKLLIFAIKRFLGTCKKNGFSQVIFMLWCNLQKVESFSLNAWIKCELPRRYWSNVVDHLFLMAWVPFSTILLCVLPIKIEATVFITKPSIQCISIVPKTNLSTILVPKLIGSEKVSKNFTT